MLKWRGRIVHESWEPWRELGNAAIYQKLMLSSGRRASSWISQVRLCLAKLCHETPQDKGRSVHKFGDKSICQSRPIAEVYGSGKAAATYLELIMGNVKDIVCSLGRPEAMNTGMQRSRSRIGDDIAGTGALSVLTSLGMLWLDWNAMRRRHWAEIFLTFSFLCPCYRS